MRPPLATAERVAAEIATRQHGIVTRSQLLGAGVTAAGIQRRVLRGDLLPVHRGVYRVGHRAPSPEAVYFAAVVACGDGALLSGRAAAHVHSLLKARPPAPEVQVIKPRRIPGVHIRRTRSPDPRDATLHRGIPITTVPRTLVDLAAVLSLDDLARACHEAGVLHRTAPRHVEAVLKRRPNSPGAAKLRGVMSGDARVTLSELERRFLDILRDAGLPLPRTNCRAGAKRVDCRWPEHGLTVELDSYRFHNSRHSWEQDRAREREARARGDEFRRFSYGDVFEERDYVRREMEMLAPS